MKGNTIFFFLSFAAVLSFNDMYSQEVLLSLDIQQRSIREVLTMIEKQSEYVFFFSDEISPVLEKKVNLHALNQPLGAILDALFVSAPLSYILNGRQVSVFIRTDQDDKGRGKALPRKRRYTGLITGESGEPLAGVNIRVPGQNKAEETDIDGCFSLLLYEGTMLDLSYLGYAAKTIRAEKDTVLRIRLSEDEKELNEIIVIGYGTVKKDDLVGSVTNVTMSDIKDASVFSADQALQGRIAGADILSTTGEPGANTSIRIRGTRSISASNEPLIVVDGMLDVVSDLTDINLSDIETISVLKDASSTAIYGSRGSNGVIIVNTKRGRKGKPSVVLKLDAGFSQLPRKLDLMNASEFAQYRNDVALFSQADSYGQITVNTPQSAFPYPDPLRYGKGTDWQEEITRVAPYQNYFLSLSGGNDKTIYYTSLSYNNMEGILEKSGIKRYTGRLNIGHRLLPQLKLEYKYSYTARDERPNQVPIGGTDWWRAAICLSPLLNPYDDFNNLWYEGQKYNSPRLILENNIYQVKKTTQVNSVSMEWNISGEWSLRSQATYYSSQSHTSKYEPGTLPGSQQGKEGRAYRSESDEINLLSETTLSYETKTNRGHHVSAIAGFTAQSWASNLFSLQGTGYLSDMTTWNNMESISDKNNFLASTSHTGKKKLSLLGRFNYHYKARYYLTVTARNDGSSNFAKNNKWAFFPSVAIKWNLSKESFIPKEQGLDELAIRFSIGRTGNDGIEAYRSLSALNATSSGYLFGGSQPVACYPGRLSSDNLTWEKTVLGNLGLDVALFRRRLLLTVEGYLSFTNDLLLNVQTPTHTGFSSRFANVGKTFNRGLELTLESRNITRPEISWHTSFTISHNRQKVKDIGTHDFVQAYGSYGGNNYMMYGYVKGYPLNALWGFKYAGTWKTQAEIDRNEVTHAYVSLSNAQKTPGCARYYDINHDGVLNENDLIYLGSADPWIYGGFQNSFRWKNLSLNLYLSYSLGGKIYNISEQWMGNASQHTNQYRYMVNAWHPVRNPESDLPRAGSCDGVASDRMVYDASFLRLKSASMSYSLDFNKKTDIIRTVRFTLSGENLWLWKKYNGFDPDVSSYSDTSTLRRIDLGAYPKSRTVVLSMQIRY